MNIVISSKNCDFCFILFVLLCQIDFHLWISPVSKQTIPTWQQQTVRNLKCLNDSIYNSWLKCLLKQNWIKEIILCSDNMFFCVTCQGNQRRNHEEEVAIPESECPKSKTHKTITKKTVSQFYIFYSLKYCDNNVSLRYYKW